MKADHIAQIEFIKSMLQNGMDRKQILQEFTKTYKTHSVKTFDNRLKIAREQLEALAKEIGAMVNKDVETKVDELKLIYLTVAERIDILSKIAKGEIPLTKPMVCDGVIELVSVVPDWMDRKNAIAELNKMTGDYSPIKQTIEATVKKEVDLSGLSFEEIESLLLKKQSE